MRYTRTPMVAVGGIGVQRHVFECPNLLAERLVDDGHIAQRKLVHLLAETLVQPHRSSVLPFLKSGLALAQEGVIPTDAAIANQCGGSATHWKRSRISACNRLATYVTSVMIYAPHPQSPQIPPDQLWRTYIAANTYVVIGTRKAMAHPYATYFLVCDQVIPANHTYTCNRHPISDLR